MTRKGRSEEQIIRASREAEAGKKVGDICPEIGVSQQGFSGWRRRNAGRLERVQELRQLREKNRKLKALAADLTLDKHFRMPVSIGSRATKRR